ncbi:ORF6N domain-containing protein [Proteus vulgaris]|uniref:ORF6N domain-containing protein n=1 Tax=Proteus vulgaris TaxID=585 RepID=UPI002577F490|nr:ORF6N domain-containing protein [Proteus vulgaris]
MSTLTVQNLPPVQHNGFRVITTELLANVYETEINNIQQNFKRNKKRFIEGKHYFKIVGDALNNLRLTMSQLQISTKVRSLILWTERGAARHAKMLDTDQAWDVFEALEDFYFAKKEDAQQKINFRQSTAKELIPLRQTAERLIAHGVGNIYPDIWKHIHKEFGVEHINELLPEQIPLAISYLDALEGEYIPKETPREVTQERTNRDMDAHHVNVLAKHYEAIYTAWKVELYPALCSVDSPIAYRLRDRLQDGYSILIRLQESLNGKHPVLIK